MLPRLEAGEALGTVNQMAIGTGSMKREVSTRQLDTWSRMAHGEPEPRRTKATPERLTAMGLKVIAIPKTRST